MALKYVQFADKTEQIIQGVFGGTMEVNPQSVEIYPYQGEVEESDERYVAFITPPEVIAITEPVEKLKAFLTENPDVAAILK